MWLRGSSVNNFLQLVPDPYRGLPSATSRHFVYFALRSFVHVVEALGASIGPDSPDVRDERVT